MLYLPKSYLPQMVPQYVWMGCTSREGPYLPEMYIHFGAICGKYDFDKYNIFP